MRARTRRALVRAGGVLALLGAIILAIHFAGAILTFFDSFNDDSYYDEDGSQGGAWIKVIIRPKAGASSSLWQGFWATWRASTTSCDPEWKVNATYYPNQQMEMWVEIEVQYQKVDDIRCYNVSILTFAYEMPGKTTLIGSTIYQFVDENGELISHGGYEGTASWESSHTTRKFNEHITDMGFSPCQYNTFYEEFYVMATVRARDYVNNTYLTVSVYKKFAAATWEKYVSASLSAEVYGNVLFSSWLPLAGMTLTGIGALLTAIPYIKRR